MQAIMSTSPGVEGAAIQRGSAGSVAWPAHCEAEGRVQVQCGVGVERSGGVGGREREKDGCDEGDDGRW